MLFVKQGGLKVQASNTSVVTTHVKSYNLGKVVGAEQCLPSQVPSCGAGHSPESDDTSAESAVLVLGDAHAISTSNPAIAYNKPSVVLKLAAELTGLGTSTGFVQELLHGDIRYTLGSPLKVTAHASSVSPVTHSWPTSSLHLLDRNLVLFGATEAETGGMAGDSLGLGSDDHPEYLPSSRHEFDAARQRAKDVRLSASYDCASMRCEVDVDTGGNDIESRFRNVDLEVKLEQNVSLNAGCGQNSSCMGAF